MLDPYPEDDPRHVGPFHLLGSLGQGGFGVVHAAHEEADPEDLIALKVPHPFVVAMEDFATRFSREVAALKSLKGAQFPAFRDASEDSAAPWFATDLVCGLSIEDLVRNCGIFPESAIWRIGYDISSALMRLEDVKMVHRDVTPSNVLISRDGPMLVDFGLVRFTERPASNFSRVQIIGNRRYAPPEQVIHPLEIAGKAGTAADVYLLGATMLFMATGHPPRDADTQEELERQAREDNANLSGLPFGPLYSLVSKCLLRSVRPRPLLGEVKSECQRRMTAGVAFADLLPNAMIERLASFERRLADLAASCRSAPRARVGTSGIPQRQTDPATYETGQLGSQPPQRSAPTMRYTKPFDEASQLSEPIEDDSVRGIPVVACDVELRTPRGNPTGVHWTRELQGWIQAGITLVDGVVVAASVDGTVAALDAATGRKRWAFRLRSAVRSAAVPLGEWPTAVEEICLGDADGGVYAVSVQTGEMRPLLYADAAIEGSPLVIRSWVYAISADACIYQADLQVTSRRMFFREDDVRALGPAVASLDTIYVPSTDGQLLAVNAQTGVLRWRIRTEGRVCSAPLLRVGRLFLTATDGLVRMVDTDDGRLLAIGELTAPAHVAPVYYQKRLYVSSSDGTVKAFDLPKEQGHMLNLSWQRQVDGEVTGITADGGRIYVAANDRVQSFDAVDGTPRHSYFIDSLVVGAPVLSEGRIYLAGLGGTVRSMAL